MGGILSGSSWIESNGSGDHSPAGVFGSSGLDRSRPRFPGGVSRAGEIRRSRGLLDRRILDGPVSKYTEMVGPVGIEPTTFGLKARCSAN